MATTMKVSCRKLVQECSAKMGTATESPGRTRNLSRFLALSPQLQEQETIMLGYGVNGKLTTPGI